MDREHESFESALIDAVRASGGSKELALQLWPAQAARDIEGARRKLASCLDPDRQEKLSLDELLVILRSARDARCHVAIDWLCEHLGYEAPKPVPQRDEADRLRQQFVAATADLHRLAERIEALAGAAKSRRG